MVQLRSGAVAMLALLAWGCQEPASGPTGPDGPAPLFHVAHSACEAHNKNDSECGGSGGGPGGEFEVTIDGGLVASNQTVQVNSDNKKKFVAVAPAFNGVINLTGTQENPNPPPGDCVYSSAGDFPARTEGDLFALLVDGLQEREFIMFFDRSDEAGFNQIQYKWDDGQLRLYIGRVPNKGDRLVPTVAKEDPEAEGTFTFSAGEVRLFSGFGNQSSDIRCRLEDVVTLVFTAII